MVSELRSPKLVTDLGYHGHPGYQGQSDLVDKSTSVTMVTMITDVLVVTLSYPDYLGYRGRSVCEKKKSDQATSPSSSESRDVTPLWKRSARAALLS